MTNAPGTQRRDPLEDSSGRAEAEPLFPSEGTFSAVVPLSQVRDGRVAAKDSAVTSSAKNSAVASAAAPKESEEEATLVPARLSRATRARRASAQGRDVKAKRGGRGWLVPAAAVLLSVTAGVAAG